MVRIEIVDVSFNYKSIKALENITVKFNEGEIVSIIGPNGAGKTTLLKCIARILKPRKGVIYVNGKELWGIPSKKLAKILAYSMSEIPRGFNATVMDFILTSRYPYVSGFWETPKDMEVVFKALEKVNAEHLASRRVDELSSGEFQRVIIAKLLAQEAKIMLLDEPIVHLDIKYQLEVLHMLREISKRKNVTTIMTMHDLRLASMFSDKLILLHRGKIVAIGDPKKVLTKKNIVKVYGVNVEVLRDSKLGIVIIPLHSLS